MTHGSYWFVSDFWLPDPLLLLGIDGVKSCFSPWLALVPSYAPAELSA